MWSKLQHWAAALVCGLLLLNGSSAAWAASHKSSSHHKTSKAAKKAAKQPAKTAKKTLNHKAGPESEIGSAELLVADTIGLSGKASFYGQGFHGQKTATGERFDRSQFTAASNRFPLGTMVAVRRLDSERCAVVKVNDRMHAKHKVRIIDVSRGVAEYLDMVRAGVVLVRVAPLRKGWKQDGTGACRAAFEPETDCPSCGRPPRLPDFGDGTISPD